MHMNFVAIRCLFRKAISPALTTALLISSGAPLFAIAAAYPERTVTIICPTEPGGPTDIAARLLVEKLNENASARFVVENRAGASGAVGIQAVMRARPDGYTIAYAGSGSVTSAPLMSPELGMAPLAELEPVAVTLASAPFFFITHPDSGVSTLGALVEQSRAAPSKFFFSTPGAGLLNTIVTLAFVDIASAKVTEVAYKGNPSAMSALLTRQVQLTAAPPSSFRQQVSAGKMIPLAVIAHKRYPEFPKVPTVAEAGFPKMMEISDWVAWQGVFAPKATPREIVTALNAVILKALKDPGLLKRATDIGLVSVVEMNPAAAGAFHARDYENWKKIILQFNLKAN